MPRRNLTTHKRISTSVIIDRELWKRFKIKCVELERPMTECLEEALTEHFSDEGKK